MKLMEHLSKHDKDKLKEMGQDLGLTLPGGENAQKWRERIAEALVKPEVVEARLSTLNDRQIALFERACEGMFPPDEDEIGDAFAAVKTFCAFQHVKADKLDKLETLDFERILEEGPREPEEAAKNLLNHIQRWMGICLTVPEEIAAVYREINTPEFQRRRHVSSWLKVCVDVCGKLYAVTPVSVLARVYALKEPIDEEEVRRTLRADGWTYDEAADRVLCRDMQDTEIQSILDSQGDRDFCLPRLENMEDLSSGYYPLTLPAYQRFRDFLRQYCGMDNWDAEGYVEGLWDTLLEDENDREGDLQWLVDVTGVDQKVITVLAKLYENCMRDTPCIAYRGRTRAEVAQSPDALTVRASDFDLDFETELPRVRIGRNEPCPCGSGKKYKKCCGR